MRKHWIEILAAACTLVILYGSMVPFDFTWHPEIPDVPTYFGVPIVGVNFPDVASNIAMYLPFGVLVSAFFVRRGLPLLAAILATMLIAGAMGYSIELTQKFIVSRVASIADVLCNIIGAGIGVIAYAPKSTLARRCVKALKDELADSPSALPAVAWTMGIVMVSLAPFDLVFDVSHLGRAFRAAYFMPFAKHADLISEVLAAPPTTDIRLSFASVHLWNLRLDYVADLFLFAVLGILAARHLRVVGRQRISAILSSCALTTATAVFVTGAGIFVMSVGLDSTRFITRISGGVLGAVFLFPVFGVETGDARALRGVWRERLRLGVIVCMVYIIARELLPFEIDTVHAGAKIARIEWLPMQAYLLALLPLAATDAILKSSRFIMLGGGLALMWLLQGVVICTRLRVKTALAIAAGLAVLEFAQCWLPGRVPAVTDCILAAVMTSGGIVLGESLYKFHLTLVAESTMRRADRALLNVELPEPAGATASPAPQVKPTSTRSRNR